MRVVTTGSFVGRTDELAVLRAAVSDTGSGVRAVVVTADAGLGKTALLSEAIRHAGARRTLRIAGHEPEQRVPLGAVAAVLRELASTESATLLHALFSDHAKATRVVNMHVFEAVYRELTRLVPVLVAVDDLQWLDEESRALLHYVLRAASTDGVDLAIVAAGRRSPVTSSFVLALERMLPPTNGDVELALGPLDAGAGVELARLVNSALSDEEARQIWAATAGSPFWIELSARTRGPTESASTAVMDFLRDLSPDAAQCLGALVVVARPVDAAELAEALSWTTRQLEAATGELTLRGVVEADGTLLRITHDIVREAAREEIPPSVLAALHDRWAQTLRRHAGGDLQRLMEALEHLAGTAEPPGVLALEILQSPRRRMLGAQGMRRLSDVADATNDGQLHIQLQAELAALAAELGDQAEAMARWRRIAIAARSPCERAAAAVKAGRHAIEIGDGSLLQELIAQTRKEQCADPWVEVSVDALEYHRLAWIENEFASAQPYRQRALTKARQLMQSAGPVEELPEFARAALIEALDAERISLLMSDRLEEMVEVSEELIDATRGLGERHLDYRVGTCLERGFLNRWLECERLLLDVIAEARRNAYPGVLAYASYHLAVATYHMGRVEEAGALYAEAQRLGQHIDAAYELSFTWLSGLNHLIEASTGDWRAAVAALSLDAQRHPSAHNRLILWQRAATCAARYGGVPQRTEVDRLLQRAHADAEAAGCPRCMWELRLVTAELAARVGDLDEAARRVAEWDATYPNPHVRAEFLRARTGAVVAAAAHSPDAPAKLRDLRDRAAAGQLRLDETWALLDLGAALAAAADRDGAAEAWQEAALLANDLGARTEAALARSQLRAIGVRPNPPAARPAHATTAVAALTRRELEVAQLVAAGARNADVAAALFISPKTVEQHVSRVLTKLDVRSRAELAARHADALRMP